MEQLTLFFANLGNYIVSNPLQSLGTAVAIVAIVWFLFFLIKQIKNVCN